MTQDQYTTELQNIAINAINALRITGCADKRADDLSEKLEALADSPKRKDSTMKKNPNLAKLLNEAILLAGEAVALAEAYAGGESETCDELTLQLTKLEERAEKATNQQ
jgi:hypothetical protein